MMFETSAFLTLIKFPAVSLIPYESPMSVVEAALIFRPLNRTYTSFCTVVAGGGGGGDGATAAGLGGVGVAGVAGVAGVDGVAVAAGFGLLEPAPNMSRS